MDQFARPRRALGLALLALAMGVAACNGPQHGAGGQASSVGERLSYPVGDYRLDPTGKPVDGGEIKIAASSDAGSLDLHAISHGNAQWLGRLIYDNLVYLDNTGEVTPWLAKSWDVSPDGKTYTFHLRQDVTFSDGAPFDAEAVRANLEHMRDPATKSPLAAAYIAPYDHGEVVDRYTFRAYLREPYHPFLNVLAQSWLAMESPKAIRETPKALADHPVGSGPYVVESYTRQQGIRLIRRKDYHWEPDFVGYSGPAHIERVDIDVVPEAITRFTSLASGQYDLIFETPLQNAAAIRADPALVFDSRMRTGVAMRAITFNTEKAPFDDVQVRRAFIAAVDRDAIVHSVGFGEMAPKGDYMSATTADYDPAFRNVLTHDVAAANRLLDEAGWTARDAQGFRTKNGKRLSAQVLVQPIGTSVPTVVAIQSDVKKIGFDLHLVQLPTAELSERRNSGDYQALGAGVWHTNTPDGLYIVFDSHEITDSRRIGQNTARLRDAQLDEALEQARRSADPAILKTLYSRAQQRLVELAPAVPLYENDSVVAYRQDLHGLLFDTSHNTPVFWTAWLQRGAS
jgi:peptide/nickel transport system substrate-binding protein